MYSRKSVGPGMEPSGTPASLTKVKYKACVHYFLSNFYFSPNDSPLETMKNVFYFI